MPSNLIHPPAAFVVRHAVADDTRALAGLIDQLAAHHGDRATTDDNALRTDLFASSPWATALVAEGGGRLVGYALLVRLYQAQYAARAMDLHHLFVVPDARNSGIGKALIEAARTEAAARGCVRLVVGTHPENRRAQSFYRMLGCPDLPPHGPRFEIPLDASRILTGERR
ncbi:MULTISPECIES: GNAT family N-acetyltransferase [Methylobacterium]|uniref:GNAT family N-acetyltransferase n=1 Tax=Methylobacterium TaxID=407 RepID=UPI0013EB5121|nr:GNAT family N-acetyltransferase [Methylobacterium sp. DB0501]NGM33836.1 GNAT family N-acetyltransferase [Methylobacterium sp. DB0501]